MEFRLLTENDIPSLLELYVQLDEINAGLELEESKKTWKRISENKSIKYFGAVDNGKVFESCWSSVFPNMTHHGRSICFIENVITDKNYRKQGLARKVIEMATDDAKANNCYMAVLLSNSRRTEAHEFYKKIGFDGDRKRGFYLSLE